MFSNFISEELISYGLHLYEKSCSVANNAETTLNKLLFIKWPLKSYLPMCTCLTIPSTFMSIGSFILALNIKCVLVMDGLNIFRFVSVKIFCL